MSPKNGGHTGEFGLWLTQYLKASDHFQNLIVFYDHGNPDEYPNVVAVKGFYGQQVANRNRLADVDVLVANQDYEILLLIEIEESKMPPKTILGDVFSILFCNRVAVKIDDGQQYFSIGPETQLFVAGIVPGRGGGREKIEEVIRPRLRQIRVPEDAIQVKNIDFVYGDDISETLCKLKCRMKTIFTDSSVFANGTD